MQISQYMTAYSGTSKLVPRPASTYRAQRRNAAKVKMRIAHADGERNDATIQRSERPVQVHRGLRECARRVRQMARA